MRMGLLEEIALARFAVPRRRQIGPGQRTGGMTPRGMNSGPIGRSQTQESERRSRRRLRFLPERPVPPAPSVAALPTRQMRRALAREIAKRQAAEERRLRRMMRRNRPKPASGAAP